MSPRFPRTLCLGLVALLPLLSGCGASTEDTAQAVPVAPVEVLYNNGVDALNARRFSSAAAAKHAKRQVLNRKLSVCVIRRYYPALAVGIVCFI